MPVVPVLYREKIRVSRSEINFFLNIFFMVLAFFSGRFAVESRLTSFLGSQEGRACPSENLFMKS